MNKKTRIIRGFSMVEMMLLLVIVSLMLASGVAVISKKHVKVPRLALHGAYMCYVRNGQLHQEKYLGVGLTNKVLDEDTTQCVFTPPARASYFHIQATGGGGGGGAAGYTGGNIVTYESELEYITPFGITPELLELKGITETELEDLGGKLWAYADGTGEFGDGGKGGDLYYIHKECSGDCMYYREWEYKGTNQRECKGTTATAWVTVTDKIYRHNCTKNCGGSGEPSCSGKDIARCDDHVDECRNQTSEPSGSGWSCAPGYTSTSYCRSTSSCTSDYTCYAGHTDKDGKCDYGYKNTCTRWCRETSECDEGTYNTTCDVNCTNITGKPTSAICTTNSTDEQVYCKDTYAKDLSKLPSYRVKKDGPWEYHRGVDDIKERQVKRDNGDAKDICNYGNTSWYTTNGGIFGSFIMGEESDIECNTESLRAAFGEQMMYLGLAADTSMPRTETKGVCEAYNINPCTKGDKFPYYLLTEESSLDDAFGTSYRNVYDDPDGGGLKKEGYIKWTDPYGAEYEPEEKIPTSCNITPSNTTAENTYGCSSYESDSSYWLVSSSTDRSYSTTYTKSYSCQRPSTNESGSKCLYSYDKVAANDPEQEKYCAYIPQVAAGGAKGIGKFCALNDVKAGLEIKYKGDSSIIAGINGSDLILIGGDYAPLYTKAAYEVSLGNTGFAENGTESQGSAHIEMIDSNGNKNYCDLHKDKKPGKGQGAYKKTSGIEEVFEGQDAPYIAPPTGDVIIDSARPDPNTLDTEGSLEGAGYTEDYGRKCGDNHVGYCLKSDAQTYPRENGKYTYKYTWQTNYLQYGEGGKAGEYRVKIIRSFNNKNIEITLGRGGKSGGNNGTCDGADGTDTIVGDILTAKGGKGGRGCIPTSTEQLPYWYDGGEFIQSQSGGNGELASVTNYQTNIINLVLPVDTTKLGQWMASSGAGGNGGGSSNSCWASEWVREFEGQQLDGIGELDKEDLADCRNQENLDEPAYVGTGKYSSGGGDNGFDGVVLIKW